MENAIAPSATLVCTIGHSNRPLDEFLDLLQKNDVGHVLDVRTVPRSRHNPQFNRDALPASLELRHIAYTHLAGLGGLRHALADSPNGGWRNLSFRGYADYMQTPEFAASLQELMSLAGTRRCALMCAEAVPWRCHRSLIGDALLVRGFRVEDIIGPKGRKPHTLTSFARVDGNRVTYPPFDDPDDDEP
ncbi:MAG TPA: DNA repair protein [Janthinobacterium sp.]|nr:DNA repair protein [Janthinobacterium sp.]